MEKDSFDINRLEESVTVSDHNPAWAAWFSEEISLLESALGGHGARFEHVGSSAVNGLKSKPIVDIMIGLQDLEIPPATQNSIEALGYEYFGRLHADQARLFARKRGERAFNLQIVPFGAREWEEKLLFRDFLRSHPEAVTAYSRIKDEAITAGKTSLLEYHRSKDQAVNAILEKALKWGRGVPH